ncbi:MAG: type IV secretory system conjugative DNA transfer family protein [Oscillospiraceae bacterium]|nr:type IV secretory system conjugative DNA transfer family protein [Oscillospiraceae bacterium]
MSTEMKWGDILPSLKLAGRLFVGLSKGAWWLGSKSVSTKPKSKTNTNDTFSELQHWHKKGVVFGKSPEKHLCVNKMYDKYVGKPETLDGHVLVVGGVGSGKSSCIAIPTLRIFKGSIFAIDIKGELEKETRVHRNSNRRIRLDTLPLRSKTFSPG